MNRPDDDLVRKVVEALDHGAERVDAGTRERLASMRQLALSRYRERPEPVWGFAWALNAISQRGVQRQQHGARYVLAACALVLALIGVAYWQSTPDYADIDVNLLTDDLPINAYLDKGFDAWLKRGSR